MTRAVFGSNIEIQSKIHPNTFLSRFTGNAKIKVYQSEKFQKIVGFGAALTGSVVHNINLMKDEIQKHIYK